MTTMNIDWLESKYFYRDSNNIWKHKVDTPSYLIKQFKSFMEAQNKLYGSNSKKIISK